MKQHETLKIDLLAWTSFLLLMFAGICDCFYFSVQCLLIWLVQIFFVRIKKLFPWRWFSQDRPYRRNVPAPPWVHLNRWLSRWPDCVWELRRWSMFSLHVWLNDIDWISPARMFTHTYTHTQKDLSLFSDPINGSWDDAVKKHMPSRYQWTGRLHCKISYRGISFMDKS